MTAMAEELNELKSDPVQWVLDVVTDLVMTLLVVCAVAAAAAFPLHLAFNSFVAVLGWPNAVGGYWDCALIAIGFITVCYLLRYALGMVDRNRDDNDPMSLARLMVALGIAAWLVTLVS